MSSSSSSNESAATTQNQTETVNGETYTLYDIPSKDFRCWSPNTWRARAILNAKKVPYTTEWVEYPDIAGVVSGFGLEPLDDNPAYTLPLLRISRRDPNTETTSEEFLRDSSDILTYINSQYPSAPPIDLTSAFANSYKTMQFKPGRAFFGIVLTTVYERLSGRSATWYHETRTKDFGMGLAEYREKALREEAWREMEDWVAETREVLRVYEGPFHKGDELSFLDIRLVGLLKWAEVGGRTDDFEKIMEFGGKEFELFWDEARKVFCTIEG